MLDSEQLINALRSLELRPRSYSGRGMWGKQCVGVVCRDMSPFELGVELALLVGDEVRHLTVTADAFGRDQILYFPRVRWPDNLPSTAEQNEDEE